MGNKKLTKTELERKLRKINLVIRQEITHLEALTQIPVISENHHILGSLDLSIFKLWNALSEDSA